MAQAVLVRSFLRSFSFLTRSRRWPVGLLIVTVLVLGWGCEDCGVDPPLLPCALVERPGRPVDPCTEGSLVVGPIRFTRDRGAPVTETQRFALARDTRACVVVRNGEERPRRIASAQIAIDGETLAGPDAFNQNVQRIERRVDLSAGDHEVAVTLGSAPEAWIEVEVRGERTTGEERHASVSALERLRYESCLEQNLAASELSPEELDEERARARAFGLVPGQMVVNEGPWGTPSWLAPLPEDGLTGDTAEERAADWLERHRDLFMAQDARVSFTVAQTRSDALTGNRVVAFHQRLDGVPLVPSRAAVALDISGRPLWFAGSIVPAAALPTATTPAIDEPTAVAAVRARLGSGAGAGSLVVLDLRGVRVPETALAWQVGFETDGGRPLVAWVEARTAEVLTWRDTDEHLHDLVPLEAVVERVTLQDCFEGASRIRTTEVRFDSTVAPPSPDCPGDPDCRLTVGHLETLHHYMTGNMLRCGWAGEGAGPIEACAPYPVVIGFEDPGGPRFRQEFMRMTGELMSWQARFPAAFLSADALSHEFGHGWHLVDRGAAPAPGLAWPNGTLVAAIQEGPYADALSLLADRAADRSLAVRDRAGTAVRDHSISRCTRYEEGACDFRTTSFDSVCGPGLPQPTGCREYTHMRFFPDARLEPLIVRSAISDGRELSRFPEHAMGCALLRPLAILLREGRGAYQGVPYEPFAHEGDFTLHDMLWRRFIQVDGAIVEAESWEDYQEELRQATVKLTAECADRGERPPCDPGFDEGLRAHRAMLAAGFWSARQQLTHMADDAELYRAAPTSGVAAALAPGPVPEVWLLFPGPDGVLRFARDSDPLDDLDPEPLQVALSAGVARAAGDPALAPDPVEGRMLAAYRELGTDRLRVLRAGTGVPWQPVAFASPTIVGSPALAVHDGETFVAYRNAVSGRLEVLRSGRPDTPEPVIDTSADEHDPFLLAVPRLGALLLLTAQGPQRVCDSIFPEVCETEVHVQLVRAWLGARFDLKHVLRRAPMPYGLGAAPSSTQEDLGRPVGGVAGVGPAAAAFAGRVHHFVPATTTDEFSSTLLSTYSFEPDARLAAVPRSESRILGQSGAGMHRVAAVGFPDPEIVAVLVLYFADASGLIHRRWRAGE